MAAKSDEAVGRFESTMEALSLEDVLKLPGLARVDFYPSGELRTIEFHAAPKAAKSDKSGFASKEQFASKVIPIVGETVAGQATS
ncbi:MAG TPA: hypothetical protein VN650_11005 [Gemmatimonadaceae bacterium]|nr:hypothetical protein [Gemmatimonadaceae bacterium]